MKKVRSILALIGASLHPVDERLLAAKKQNGRPEAARYSILAVRQILLHFRARLLN